MNIECQVYSLTLGFGSDEVQYFEPPISPDNPRHTIWTVTRTYLNYKQSGGLPWRWSSVVLNGVDRKGRHREYTFEYGDHMTPSWLVGLIYQYYPQGPDRRPPR